MPWTKSTTGTWLPPDGVGAHRHDQTDLDIAAEAVRLVSLEASRTADESRLTSLESSRTTDEAKLALLQTTAWTAYTPTLTNVTIGNGALEAWYVTFGKTIHCRGHFDLGGSSSVTGSISLSLPVTAKDAYYAGSVYMLDAGIQHYGGMLAGQSTTTALIVLSTGAAGATAPFSWGPADKFQWTLTYEAA